eukprot:14988-Heterococcus_DN1.PRE.1
MLLKASLVLLVCACGLALQQCFAFALSALQRSQGAHALSAHNTSVFQTHFCSLRHAHRIGRTRRTVLMAAPTPAEVQKVIDMAVKAIAADTSAQAMFGGGVNVLGLQAQGKPKEGSVNIRFLIKGVSAGKVVGEGKRSGGQGQVTAQTESNELVRCWIDLDSGWGRR